MAVKKRWQKEDRIILPTGRPAVVEAFVKRGEDYRMLCRYTDTLQHDTVEIPVTLPRVREGWR